MKPCPYCAEQIQDAAIKCKHCGSELQTSKQTSPSTAKGAAQHVKVTPLGCLALVVAAVVMWKVSDWISSGSKAPTSTPATAAVETSSPSQPPLPQPTQPEQSTENSTESSGLTPTRKSLGVSRKWIRRQARDMVEDLHCEAPTKLGTDEPRVLCKGGEGALLLEIIGPRADITQLSVTFAGTRQAVLQATMLVVVLTQHKDKPVLRGDEGVTDMMKRHKEGEDSSEEVIDGLLVSFRALHELGLNIMTVSARPPDG